VELSDADIMQRVQGGQFELFDRLVLRYRGALLHAAWSKLGDRAWAEDVVQETFLAAFAARHTFQPQLSFRAWLWTILLNLCRRQWKRRAERPQELFCPRFDGPATAVPEPISHDGGLVHLLGTERREELLMLLARLPESQADALRLRFFGGLQFAEIAQAMDSSVSGAKLRVKMGLQTLAQLFCEQEGDAP